jgi:hypothetical protein
LAHRQGKRVAEVAGEAIATWLDYQGWTAEVRREMEAGWRQAHDPEAEWFSPDESRADLDRRKAQHRR